MGICLTYQGGLCVILILGILMILCGIGITKTANHEESKDTKREESHDKGGNQAET